MRTPERVALMKKYFTVYGAEYPSFSNIIRISLGMVLFGTFIMYYFNNTIIAGTLFILLGLFLFAFWIRPYFRDLRLFKERPPVQHMYNWLIEDLNTNIKERATKVLRLNMKDLRSENFLIVPHPVYWAEPGVDEKFILKRETEDDKVLYNIWKVQIVALTKNYISFYTCTYDWLGDSISNERTNEFFFDDISSVKNDVDDIDVQIIGQEEKVKLSTFEFKVTNMSSDSLSVITNIPQMNYSLDLAVSLEKAVQALRIILRSRRYDEEQDPIILEPEVKDDIELEIEGQTEDSEKDPD